jgi:hypothetical protein
VTTLKSSSSKAIAATARSMRLIRVEATFPERDIKAMVRPGKGKSGCGLFRIRGGAGRCSDEFLTATSPCRREQFPKILECYPDLARENL